MGGVGSCGENHSRELRQMVWGIVLQRFAQQVDLTREGRLEGGKCAQQGTLAHAVGTYQARQLIVAERGVKAFRHDVVLLTRPVAYAQVFQDDGFVCH